MGVQDSGHPEYRTDAWSLRRPLAPSVKELRILLGWQLPNVGSRPHFNRPGHEIVNHRVYAIAGDGCMMEGVSQEAASLAGHLRLSNLVWIYDNNHITIEGNTALAFSDDVAARFTSYHWNVLRVGDANDTDLLNRALQTALNETERPSLIIVDSHIAWALLPNRTLRRHTANPLEMKRSRLTKQRYGWPSDAKFLVPDETKAYTDRSIERGRQAEEEWNVRFSAYKATHPQLADDWERMNRGELPDNWDKNIRHSQQTKRVSPGVMPVKRF
jgi:transketolase